jgi:hypothetical protein
MASSGNYKKQDIPEESAFMPVARRATQDERAMAAEFQKLAGL